MEWLELESDPGLFTLLIQDFGVSGVKVEEIYDVTRTFEDRVYGFVFLFQWIEERKARKKSLLNDECYVTEPTVLENMFFAHQVVTNSCATHALLSILLNCVEGEGLELGPTLPRLKQFCHYLNPEMRGHAIGNMPDLASAHNQHAKPDPPLSLPPPSKRGSVVSSAYLSETYHFVSFVPIGERLFELDGLKEWPIDHGPWAETENWTDLFERIITRRLNEGEGIQFNLMALIPDPLPKLSQEMKLLHTKEKELLDTIYQLASDVVRERHTRANPDPSLPQDNSLDEIKLDEEIVRLLESDTTTAQQQTEQDVIKLHETISAVRGNQQALDQTRIKFNEELEARNRYQVDAERRTHDYDMFFTEYFKAMATYNLLPERIMEPKKSVRRGHVKKGRHVSGGMGAGRSKKQSHSKSKTFSNGSAASR